MFVYNTCFFVPSTLQFFVPLVSTDSKPVKQEEENPSLIISKEQEQIDSSSTFRRLLEQELGKRKSEPRKKRPKDWSQEEDSRLVALAESSKDWELISKHFVGKNSEVCLRRFKRLSKKEKNWPRQKEEKIKYYRQVEGLSWTQIQKLLQEDRSPMAEHNSKQIRERYKNYLQINSNYKDWSIQEDLKLWDEISQRGNKWTEISTLFSGKTELQVKNRYYKVIGPLRKRINKQMKRDGLMPI